MEGDVNSPRVEVARVRRSQEKDESLNSSSGSYFLPACQHPRLKISNSLRANCARMADQEQEEHSARLEEIRGEREEAEPPNGRRIGGKSGLNIEVEQQTRDKLQYEQNQESSLAESRAADETKQDEAERLRLEAYEASDSTMSLPGVGRSIGGGGGLITTTNVVYDQLPFTCDDPNCSFWQRVRQLERESLHFDWLNKTTNLSNQQQQQQPSSSKYPENEIINNQSTGAGEIQQEGLVHSSGGSVSSAACITPPIGNVALTVSTSGLTLPNWHPPGAASSPASRAVSPAVPIGQPALHLATPRISFARRNSSAATLNQGASNLACNSSYLRNNQTQHTATNLYLAGGGNQQHQGSLRAGSFHSSTGVPSQRTQGVGKSPSAASVEPGRRVSTPSPGLDGSGELSTERAGLPNHQTLSPRKSSVTFAGSSSQQAAGFPKSQSPTNHQQQPSCSSDPIKQSEEKQQRMTMATSELEQQQDETTTTVRSSLNQELSNGPNGVLWQQTANGASFPLRLSLGRTSVSSEGSGVAISVTDTESPAPDASPGGAQLQQRTIQCRQLQQPPHLQSGGSTSPLITGAPNASASSSSSEVHDPKRRRSSQDDRSTTGSFVSRSTGSLGSLGPNSTDDDDEGEHNDQVESSSQRDPRDSSSSSAGPGQAPLSKTTQLQLDLRLSDPDATQSSSPFALTSSAALDHSMTPFISSHNQAPTRNSSLVPATPSSVPSSTSTPIAKPSTSSTRNFPQHQIKTRDHHNIGSHRQPQAAQHMTPPTPSSAGSSGAAFRPSWIIGDGCPRRSPSVNASFYSTPHCRFSPSPSPSRFNQITTTSSSGALNAVAGAALSKSSLSMQSYAAAQLGGQSVAGAANRANSPDLYACGGRPKRHHSVNERSRSRGQTTPGSLLIGPVSRSPFVGLSTPTTTAPSGLSSSRSPDQSATGHLAISPSLAAPAIGPQQQLQSHSPTPTPRFNFGR